MFAGCVIPADGASDNNLAPGRLLHFLHDQAEPCILCFEAEFLNRCKLGLYFCLFCWDQLFLQ